MSILPYQFTTESQIKNEGEDKLQAEAQKMDTLPNAFAQLMFIMVVMMPQFEKNVSSNMEYQDYLMDQVSNYLMPRVDDIKSDFNTIINSNPNDYKDYRTEGNDAVGEANQILQLVYTNPNLSSNTQLVSNLTSAISNLFTCNFYEGTSNTNYSIALQDQQFTVTINGQSEEIEVPQLVGSYNKNDGTGWHSMSAGDILPIYWDGYDYYTSSSQFGSGENLSAYENEIQGWTADLNEMSTNLSDFSKTATSVFQFYMGEAKQLLSIWDNSLQDIAKGEQQAINNEITS